ncbi:radical SAM protein [Candidatus Poribacteria bacterium]|nr:radical SAM protein [Candidatus Poribacteria bacterium]
MKTLLLNPPYKSRIMRRYSTTYYAPNFLFPPYELMCLGTIVKEWKKDEVRLLDAIAENYDLEYIIKFIADYKPNLLISMTGYESFSDDIEILSHLKTRFPEIKIIVFGYIPSLFSEELLKQSNLDIVIRGEPETTFSFLYDLLKSDKSLRNVLGITFREGGTIIHNPSSPRINELDDFPFPDPELINLKSYREPYLGRPIMALYSSRGCNGSCNYCVKSFGSYVHSKTPENVVKKIKWYKNNFKIKNFRFLDDNFTFNKKRVLEICHLIMKEKLKINWTCLSRIDTLDYEILLYMKKSGCKRIYLGVESGSQQILNFYNKKYTVSDIRLKISLLREIGMLFTGFFIVGAPIETDEDVQESIRLAIKENFDFVVVTRLKFSPGTEIFEKYKDKIKFNLFPYKVAFDEPGYDEKTLLWEKLFYRKFYFRFRYYLKKLKLMLISPITVIQGAQLLKKFIKNNKTRDFI